MNWAQAGNVLAVRLDHLGNVLMTTPALAALKAGGPPTRRLTLLTSPASAALAPPHLPMVDEVIAHGAAWMPGTRRDAGPAPERALIARLATARFDAAVIFTAYSQSALPAALACQMAGIPLRLAHSRANPYRLLSDWVRECEPHAQVRHEVRRQLDLVAAIGCSGSDDGLVFRLHPRDRAAARRRDRQELLTRKQLARPLIHLEHDPPLEHPTDTRHFVQDPRASLVHVTPFNALMWDSGMTPVRVIEHGVMQPRTGGWRGDLPRGLGVVINLETRGRRLGLDIYQAVRRHVPLDLVGMDAQSAGGLGEIANPDLPALMTRYRFLFNPVRYTSLGLAVIEAMMVGLPVVVLATTELATVVRNEREGFLANNTGSLIAAMHRLLREAGAPRHG